MRRGLPSAQVGTVGRHLVGALAVAPACRLVMSSNGSWKTYCFPPYFYFFFFYFFFPASHFRVIFENGFTYQHEILGDDRSQWDATAHPVSCACALWYANGIDFSSIFSPIFCSYLLINGLSHKHGTFMVD